MSAHSTFKEFQSLLSIQFIFKKACFNKTLLAIEVSIYPANNKRLKQEFFIKHQKKVSLFKYSYVILFSLNKLSCFQKLRKCLYAVLQLEIYDFKSLISRFSSFVDISAVTDAGFGSYRLAVTALQGCEDYDGWERMTGFVAYGRKLKGKIFKTL